METNKAFYKKVTIIIYGEPIVGEAALKWTSSPRWDKTILFSFILLYNMDTESIVSDGEPTPIKSTTLSDFFDDIVMTSNNGKEKVECFGCSG